MKRSYQLQHAYPKEKRQRERTWSPAQWAAVLLGVLFFGAMAAATAWSQYSWRMSLPRVELGYVENGRVSSKHLGPSETSGKLSLQTVVQEDGPWGKRYRLREVELINYVFLKDGDVFVYGLTNVEAPIVIAADDAISNECEVRLS